MVSTPVLASPRSSSPVDQVPLQRRGREHTAGISSPYTGNSVARNSMNPFWISLCGAGNMLSSVGVAL